MQLFAYSVVLVQNKRSNEYADKRIKEPVPRPVEGMRRRIGMDFGAHLTNCVFGDEFLVFRILK